MVWNKYHFGVVISNKRTDSKQMEKTKCVREWVNETGTTGGNILNAWAVTTTRTTTTIAVSVPTITLTKMKYPEKPKNHWHRSHEKEQTSIPLASLDWKQEHPQQYNSYSTIIKLYKIQKQPRQIYLVVLCKNMCFQVKICFWGTTISCAAPLLPLNTPILTIFPFLLDTRFKCGLIIMILQL